MGRVTVRDAWVMDSSSTFVHIVAVPYAAPDHRLIKGQPYLEEGAVQYRPSTRADGARPETGQDLGVWDLRFSSVK